MGDLRADEWVCSADTSYSSQTLSELIVMGDLVARDIVLTQEVTVDGDLHAERLLFADSDGDLTLRVRGEVRAAHLDTRGHQLEVGGRIQGEHRTCERLARALADARSAE